MVDEGSDAGTGRQAMLADMFAQYLNRHGTDFSYIRSDPNFGELSDEELFGMYRAYMGRKSEFVTKIGKESRIAKIERIVGRSSCGEMGDGHAYKAQVLLDGRKRIQTVVDLQTDDFRLPFLLKDLEVHLKQQLTYIEEIYAMLKNAGAISPGFLGDCAENNCNKSDATAKDDTTDGPAETYNTFGKIIRSTATLQPPGSLHNLPSSLDGLSNICNEENKAVTSQLHAKAPSSSHGQSEKGMESMIDYPTSENHADSNTELCSGSIPNSAHSKDECDSVGHSARNIVLNADILTKYDDYLGDFNEDLLEMELPVPKTSTYNPLAPQEEADAEDVVCSTEVSGGGDAEPCEASYQTVQSTKRRCRGRVIVQPKDPSVPAHPEARDRSSNA